MITETLKDFLLGIAGFVIGWIAGRFVPKDEDTKK